VGIEAQYTWTLKLAVYFVEREFGKTFTEKGMSVLLHRLGFRYTKAAYTRALADPVKQAEFKEHTFPALKKAYRRADRSFAI
jgi:transposase